MGGLQAAPNLHPVFVHFPIAFWIGAAVMWAIAFVVRRDVARFDLTWRFGLWLQMMGLIGAAVAVGLGFWATEQMGHDAPGHDLVHVHRNIMLGATLLAAALTALAWWKRHGGTAWRGALLGLAWLLVGATTWGADKGAELVYRHGVGVSREPAPHPAGAHDHGSGHPMPEPDATGAKPEVSSAGPSSPVPQAPVPAASEAPTKKPSHQHAPGQEH